MTDAPLSVAALLEKLAARHAAADAEITHLREQIGKLTDALATAERERDRWAATRETVLALAAEHHPEPAALTRTTVTPSYQQILAVFTPATGPLRAKEICQLTDTGADPRHVEGMRSKLKKSSPAAFCGNRRGRPVHPRRETRGPPRGRAVDDAHITDAALHPHRRRRND